MIALIIFYTLSSLRSDFIFTFSYLSNHIFIMTNQFSNQQIRQIQQAFKLFDKDNDGHLTRQEVGALIREMACISSQEQISKLISQIDADGNGTVQESQFIALMANDRMMLTITSQKDMLQSFKIFDCHNEKGITFQGLKEVLLKMGEKLSDDDIMNLIKQADQDGDGKVSFEQFKRLMQR